jgi:hypothetical protein
MEKNVPDTKHGSSTLGVIDAQILNVDMPARAELLLPLQCESSMFCMFSETFKDLSSRETSTSHVSFTPRHAPVLPLIS